MSAFTETVIWHAFTGVSEDDSGNEIDVFDETGVPLAGATIWPTVSAETAGLTPVVLSGLTVVWPQMVQISALDEFTARGVRYKVDGEAGLYHHPDLPSEATQVQLRRRT